MQAPLRRIEGFSQALFEEAGEKLEGKPRDYLLRLRAGTQAMTRLVTDLLELSRAGRADLHLELVDLAVMARAIASDLKAKSPDRRVQLIIPERLPATGDPGLLRAVLDNLLSNAWKFTSKKSDARIELGTTREKERTTYFVKDDGAGFDPAYARLLFAPFQRLHKESDFPGTGVGLAVVQRIVHRHGGQVWAQGAVDQGATFSFTLGTEVAERKT